MNKSNKMINSYIEKLHVRNIGLFNLLNVEFNPRMNILIGANGSGKTSILRNMTYCMSNDNLHHSRWRQPSEMWMDTYWKGKEYRDGFRIERVSGDYRHYPTAPSALVMHTDGLFNFPAHSIPNAIYVIGAYRYFDYKRVDGMKREVIGDERRKDYRDQATQFLDGALLPDIKQWMINRYFSIDKEWSEIQRKNWENIMGLLPELVPPEMDFHFLKIERDLEPIFTFNGTECYLEELSSGLKSFLAIVFSIIDWCEGVNDGNDALMSNALGTVLIDEIDAHLHPEWQARIIGHLKNLFPCVQFIVTTHSPHVVASAEANEVIRIPPHHGELNLKPDNKSYQGWQLDFILEDVMNVIDCQPVLIDNMLTQLETAYQENDLTNYDASLAKLATVLHPNDPILKVYKLKKSNLILNQD
jgi:hypothetical protein